MVGTIQVYVRKGADDLERRISFPIGFELDQMELLDRGVAIDGNQAVFTVRADMVDDEWVYSGPFYDDHPAAAKSFTEALAIAQRELVAYLRQYGHTPNFA